MLLIIFTLAVGALLYYVFMRKNPQSIPEGDGWWGEEDRRASEVDDELIEPFKIEMSEQMIQEFEDLDHFRTIDTHRVVYLKPLPEIDDQILRFAGIDGQIAVLTLCHQALYLHPDLHSRLDNTRFTPSLEGSSFHYGFNSTYLRKLVAYWRNDYDWQKQVEHLNTFPHFRTKIEGIQVHFIHVKPGVRAARPLMMIHGWPGSFYEFYKVIAQLTEPGAPLGGFEVVCPSIPGYGFSEAPRRPGFNSLAAARVFHKLMRRLGLERYYVHGGDWGGLIATNMAQMKPENVKGIHLNFFPVSRLGLQLLPSVILGPYLPSLVGFTWTDVERMFPFMKKNIYMLLRESGYMHIQGTKPDTVGSALNDSPVGLAAYILEKFSSWTNLGFQDLEDGGLDRKFSLDELLTNVMIYWVTGSITSSMRMYKENLGVNPMSRIDAKVGVHVPAGLAAFPNELMHVPLAWAKQKYKRIVSYSYMSRGGHFAAFEEPQMIVDDLVRFVQCVEKSG